MCYALLTLLTDAGGWIRFPLRVRRFWWLLSVPVAVVLGVLSIAVVRAHRTLTQTATAVHSERNVAFALTPLAQPANPGFEPISSPATFTSCAFFQERLVCGGPGGLFAYTSDGSLRRAWRTGLDLPPAPLASLTVARLRGSSAPQLIIATAGEGVLILNTNDTLQQLRPTTAAARDITAILPLPSGDVLLGTRDDGVLSWTGNTGPDALSRFHPSLDHLHITALAADDHGFWAGTRYAGIFHWSGGAVTHFTAGDGLPDAQILSIAVRGESVFAGTPVGVEEFRHGQPARLLGRDLYANALLADPAMLTVATLDEGLHSVPLQVAPRIHAKLSTQETAEETAPVQSFTSVDDQTAYAIYADRIKRREPDGAWKTVIAPQPAALTNADISALAFDADGRLWVGTFDRGLDILTLAGDNRTEHIEDGHVFCINRIALDPARNTMAVATANGLVLFDRSGHPRQVLTRRDGLIADHVTDVAFHPGGMTLATPAGLTFVDAGAAPQSLYAFQGLVNNHVYAIALQPDGTTLAGTLGGLSLLQHEAVTRNLTVANSGLKHNWITAIATDNHGGWTAGTYGAGVMQIAADATIHALTPPFIVNPSAMLRTSTHLLAGTLDQGLWVETLATGRWAHITSGLPSENVTAFAARDGMLYIGTANGLVRIPERELPQ
jgi:outer membrane protein assembly factor BamB